MKLKEQQAQAALSTLPAPVALPARTTDQLIVEAAPAAGYSVTENTTAHLSQPVPAPRREPD